MRAAIQQELLVYVATYHTLPGIWISNKHTYTQCFDLVPATTRIIYDNFLNDGEVLLYSHKHHIQV